MKLVPWILILPLIFSVCGGTEVWVSTQEGEIIALEVDPEDTVGYVQEQIRALTDEDAYIVSMPKYGKRVRMNTSHQGGYLGHPRDYLKEVSAQEKADIRFIITSLADKSLISISFIKGDLEIAGNRIDHIHPLRFLMTVFTDEELKVGLRNIRGRGWIWNQFVSSLKESLHTESHIGNLKDEYIAHFAAVVKIDVRKIYPVILAQNWDGLIETLIKEIPRQGDHDRYNN